MVREDGPRVAPPGRGRETPPVTFRARLHTGLWAIGVRHSHFLVLRRPPGRAPPGDPPRRARPGTSRDLGRDESGILALNDALVRGLSAVAVATRLERGLRSAPSSRRAARWRPPGSFPGGSASSRSSGLGFALPETASGCATCCAPGRARAGRFASLLDAVRGRWPERAALWSDVRHGNARSLRAHRGYGFEVGAGGTRRCTSSRGCSSGSRWSGGCPSRRTGAAAVACASPAKATGASPGPAGPDRLPPGRHGDKLVTVRFSYPHWLAAITLLFVVLERLFPWRKGQALLRPGWLRDLGFLAVNGHFFSLLTAGVNGWLALRATELLQRAGVRFDASPVPSWPFWAQVVVFLLVSDFLQWCVHNALHRVPSSGPSTRSTTRSPPWTSSGTSASTGWRSSSTSRPSGCPSRCSGPPGEAAFVVAVFGTFWGDLNHANLNVGLGPLGHLFNSPRMHLWHHDASTRAGWPRTSGSSSALGLPVRDGLLAAGSQPRAAGLPGRPGDAPGASSASSPGRLARAR